MGKENLIHFSERTPEELREISIKGGIASGVARREKRKLKEELEILMDEDDNKRKVSVALLKKALSGEVKAIQEIATLLGERTEKVQNEIVDKTAVNELISSIEGLKNEDNKEIS